jgi:glucokinase
MSLLPVVLGLDFGGTKIAVAVCDLAGNQLAAQVVASGGELGAQASFDRGIAVARDLLDRRAPGAQLAAVGVSTFGIPFEDRVELAPAIPGWEKLAIGRRLRAAFAGAQIRTATDAKAAAQAEARWGSLAGCDPAVYLNLGTGLAIAIVAGGRVVAGRNGAAGEIGYSLRSVADVGLAADQRIPLEDLVSGQGLARRASGQAGGEPLAAAEVFARTGNDALAGLIAEFVDELAFHLVNLAIAVNPERIAVGGGLVGSWDRIGPRLQHALRSGVPYPPELVVAHFPYDAPLIGAVALAVDAALTVDPALATGAADTNPPATNATDTSTTSNPHETGDPEADGVRIILNQDTMA